MTSHFDIVATALPCRHGCVRKIRKREESSVPPLFDCVELDAELFDVLRPRAAGLLNLRRIETLPLGARNFVAGGVLLALQPFDLRQQSPSAGFERRQVLELAREVSPSVPQAIANGLEVVSKKGGVEHDADCTYDTMVHEQ